MLWLPFTVDEPPKIQRVWLVWLSWLGWDRRGRTTGLGFVQRELEKKALKPPQPLKEQTYCRCPNFGKFDFIMFNLS